MGFAPVMIGPCDYRGLVLSAVLSAVPAAVFLRNTFVFISSAAALTVVSRLKIAEFSLAGWGYFGRRDLPILRSNLRMAAAVLALPYAAPAAVLAPPAVSVSLPVSLGIGVLIGLAPAAAVLARFLLRLRKQEALLNKLFAQSPLAVALMERDGRIIRVNGEFTRVFGYAPEAAAGRNIAGLIVPAESQDEFQRLADLVSQGQRVDAEGVRRRQDGSRFPVAITLVPFRAPRQDAAVYAIYRDLTEQRRAQEAVRANQARWLAMFDNSAVGITVTDVNHNFIAANRIFQEMLGYSEPELRTMTYMDLTVEEDRPATTALAEDNWAGRGPQLPLEKRYRRKDGQLVWGKITVSTTSAAGPLPQIGIAIVEDITGRKLAEARLREYEKIVQGLQEMIAVVDRDYHYLLANQAYLDYRGLERDQVVGHSISELVGPEIFEQVVKKRVDECFQGRVVKYEIAVTYPKLGKRDLVSTYSPIEGPTGVDGVAVVLEDITGRKRAERELQRSFQDLHAVYARLESVREEERTSLARELHDRLGQALTAIRIDVAALKVPRGGGQQFQRIDAILGLVDGTIHAVRKISAELRPGILDDLGLVATLEWAAEDFHARTGIECRVALPETSPAIDPGRATALYRIAQEALTNVARHAGATRVTIALARNDSHLSLEVRDNGRGIDAGQLSAPSSLGIVGMRERALLLGGEFNIAGDPGCGTSVRAVVPIADVGRASTPAAGL